MSKQKQENKDVVFSLRLPPGELAGLEQEAQKTGISVSEYIRKAIALRPIGSVLTKPQIGWTIGTPHFQFGQLVTWNENTTLDSQLQRMQKECI